VRRSPRALAAWFAAFVVALVTARFVATDLATLHRRASSLGPRVAVVVAARDVPLGATVARGDVRTVTMYSSTAPRGALHDVDDAVGRVVIVPALRDSALVARQLAPARRRGLAAVVPDGSRAVRVRTDDGLRPRRGDVVDVLLSLDPSVLGGGDDGDGDAEGDGANGATTVVHAALVLAVDGDESRVETSSGPGVTLLVTEREARAVAFAAANGSLTLALAPPEAACCTEPPMSTGAAP
jgi:Flp pilus assembly protein CpaB